MLCNIHLHIDICMLYLFWSLVSHSAFQGKKFFLGKMLGAVLFLLVPSLAILWPFPSQPYSAQMEDVNIAVMTQGWNRTRTTWCRWQCRQWWNMLRLPRDSKQNPGFADWFEIPKYINIPLESFAPWLFRNMPSLQEPQYRWKSIVISVKYPIVKALLNVLQGFQTPPSHTQLQETYAKVTVCGKRLHTHSAQWSQDVMQLLSFHGGLSSHPPGVVFRDLPRSKIQRFVSYWKTDVSKCVAWQDNSNLLGGLYHDKSSSKWKLDCFKPRRCKEKMKSMRVQTIRLSWPISPVLSRSCKCRRIRCRSCRQGMPRSASMKSVKYLGSGRLTGTLKRFYWCSIGKSFFGKIVITPFSDDWTVDLNANGILGGCLAPWIGF